MNELFGKYFYYFIFGILAWVTIIIIASILYRASKEKQFFNISKENLRFHEKGVSGRSLKNLFTQIGGARNALDVKVGSEHLVIRPIFPFNLMFLPEFTDLEHIVPLDKIKDVKEVASFGKRGILIRFHNQSWTEKHIELYLKNDESFLNAIGKTYKT